MVQHTEADFYLKEKSIYAHTLSKTTEGTNVLQIKLFRDIYKYFVFFIQALLGCKEQNRIKILFCGEGLLCVFLGSTEAQETPQLLGKVE